MSVAADCELCCAGYHCGSFDVSKMVCCFAFSVFIREQGLHFNQTDSE
jgi:hypothetical protein